MLTANPTGIPPTFVAINGMLSATPTPTQLPPNPGSMLAMSSNIGASNMLSTPNPYILPPATFPQPSPNLACPANPFSSPQFQTPLFPFLTSTSQGMLTGGPIISIPSPFSGHIPQFLQSQASIAALGAFPSTISVNSVMNPLSPPQQLLPDIATISSIQSSAIPNQPPLSSIVLPASPMNTAPVPPLSITSDVAPHPLSLAVVTVSDVSTCANTVSVPSLSTSTVPAPSLSMSSCTVASTTPSSPMSSHQTSLSEPACVSPSLQNSFKIYKPQPVTSCTGLTPRTNCASNLLSLESVDFHRDEILDAIDKLRERKARPDFERISCMLKRHRNINPDQTQLCLGRLAAAGAVVCVDYKGNLSYRNPSKWRKTAATSGVTNTSSISQRLVDAVKRLMAGTVYQPNGSSGSDPSLASLLPAPPGPNDGYSLFQIERALKVSDTASSSGVALPSKLLPELTGATLRVCLDREAVHGKLAKTADGRYILDEAGERKRLANVPHTFPPPISNKIPLPPNSLASSMLCSGGRYIRASTCTPCIAPAIDLPGRPLAAKQSLTGGAVSIAPLGGRAVSSSPLLGLSSRPIGSSRRGRPPGSKARRPTALPDPSSPSEKKQKIDLPAVSIALSSSAELLRSCSDNTIASHSTSINSPVGSIRPNSASPIFPLNQNGLCSQTTMSLPTPFLTGIAQPTGICSSVLSPSVLPTPFPIPHPGDISLSHSFGGPFLTFASCGNPNFLPNRLSSSLPSDISILPQTADPMNSPVISVLSDLDTNELPQAAEEKLDLETSEDVCCYCAAPATKEEPFLECSDCHLRAHPVCLDYWPELTERARQSAWQCADCKVCSICLNKQLTTELLICDACDKGFHSECHVPKVEEPVDRSLPWVCAECQKEGYSVALGTMPEGATQQYIIPIGKCANNVVESPVKDNASTELNPPTLNPHVESEPTTAETVHVQTSRMSNTESSFSSSQCQSAVSKEEVERSPSSDSLATPQTKTLEKKTPCKSFVDDSHLDQAFHNITRKSPESPASTHGRCSDSLKQHPDLPTSDSPSSVTHTAEVGSTGLEGLHENGTTLDEPVSSENGKCLIRPLDIRAWTVEHVREWLLEEGFPREAEAFFQQEIDGACLLLMKRMDVLTELGIKLGPGVKIYERIKRLQSRCTSPTVLSA